MEHTYTYSKLFKYFKRFMQPYWSRFTVGSILRLISAILGLYPAFAFAKIVTFVTTYHLGIDLLPLYYLMILWAVSFLVRFVLIYYAKMLCIVEGQKASLDIEKGALEYLSHLDISWHQKENAGSKVKRIQRGADGILTLVRVWVINLIDIAVNFIGALIIIAHFDLLLAVLMVVYQIIYYFISSSLRRRTVLASRKKNIKDEEQTGLMFEIMNNIRSVKVLGMTKPLLQYIININIELADLQKKNIFWYHVGILARSCWQGISRVALIGFVIYEIFQGRYEVGFLILFFGYFSTLSSSIDDLASVAQDIGIAKTDIGRLSELFEQKINIDQETGKVDFPKEWDGIHIKNLSFSYGTNAVLSNLNLDIKKGEKIGIVGLSGAGKTTLFKLFLKEHEGADGDILIGEIPLRNIKKSDYVNHVAVVLQETEVFNMSLHKNILITNMEAGGDANALNRALNISHVDNFVHKLPEGIETLIGEKGVKLSGGEKQRLGIARAVFKNPEILFLDEATSHLDVESEQKIQDSLAHFFKDVTAVVIAHRLSTIREMDRIVVLEDGKIIEIGTFDELRVKNGRFSEFWDKQRE